MSDIKQEIVEIVRASIQEVNEQLPKDARILFDDGTVLLGDGGVLDSLGLINLLASIEDSIAARFGRAAGLLDDGLDLEDGTPLRTLGSLIGHLTEKLSA